MLWNFKTPRKFELDWPLADSPVPIFAILLTYSFFALKCGKLFMKNRQPYNVKNIILGYNALQVIYNTIMFIISVKYLILSGALNLRCIETLPLDHPSKFIEQALSYAYVINKILDLADTIFFVLRKSYKQITVLHVYHHIGMAIAGYVTLRFYGSGGHYIVTGTLNAFVHIVMYSYYFISALSTRVRETLWWKRYITILQMVQFIIIFLHTVVTFQTECSIPHIWLWVALSQSAVMMVMFGQFYVNAYMKPKKEHKKLESENKQK